MKIPGYLMIYNLKLFLLLILYQFIDDLVAWGDGHEAWQNATGNYGLGNTNPRGYRSET